MPGVLIYSSISAKSPDSDDDATDLSAPYGNAYGSLYITDSADFVNLRSCKITKSSRSGNRVAYKLIPTDNLVWIFVRYRMCKFLVFSSKN